MNIFRLIGDLTHLMSIIVLLLKIHTIRSCAGSFFPVTWNFFVVEFVRTLMLSTFIFQCILNKRMWCNRGIFEAIELMGFVWWCWLTFAAWSPHVSSMFFFIMYSLVSTFSLGLHSYFFYSVCVCLTFFSFVLLLILYCNKCSILRLLYALS